MKQKDTNYMNMTGNALRVLDDNQPTWKDHPPVALVVELIRSEYNAIRVAGMGSNLTSGGATDDKEAAGEKMIAIAVELSGYAQAYAMAKEDNTLLNKVRVYISHLDTMGEEKLTLCMEDLLTQLRTLPPEEVKDYKITPETLDELSGAITTYMKMKPAPRSIILDRKGHNASIPEHNRTLRNLFQRLDLMMPRYRKETPDFLHKYENARIVIPYGVRHERGEDKKGKHPEEGEK